jgi:hypothetical protein
MKRRLLVTLLAATLPLGAHAQWQRSYVIEWNEPAMLFEDDVLDTDLLDTIDRSSAGSAPRILHGTRWQQLQDLP